jgi:hypothetical protein
MPGWAPALLLFDGRPVVTQRHHQRDRLGGVPSSAKKKLDHLDRLARVAPPSTQLSRRTCFWGRFSRFGNDIEDDFGIIMNEITLHLDWSSSIRETRALHK